MKSRILLIALILAMPSFVIAQQPTAARSIQNQLRVALIGFTKSASIEQQKTIPEAALETSLKRDARIAIIESSITRPALAGLGHDGSINLTKDEARRLGAAVGCDFFITGKVESLARSEREGELHQEAYTAVMIVDGRTGALAFFDFIFEKAATRDGAADALVKAIEARAANYIERMIDYSNARAIINRTEVRSSAEPIEDLPAEGSPQSAGFIAPQFLNRVKPDYTEEAGRADVNATVEARAVFRADGEVGDVEIIRWAGFGLDESAVRAVRRLKFKPATRDGRPVSVRAVVQYNFRRVAETGAKPSATERKPEF